MVPASVTQPLGGATHAGPVADIRHADSPHGEPNDPVPATQSRQTGAGGAWRPANDARTMRHPTDLEQHFVRKSVDALAAERDRCDHCGRTPLTGERVHHYEGGQLLCELCKALCRDRPVRDELVRHSEHGLAVRLTRRAA